MITNNPMRQKYRELSDEEKSKIAAIKDVYTSLWDLIDACGASRELSIAKTKLEESCMWAVKHLTA